MGVFTYYVIKEGGGSGNDDTFIFLHRKIGTF